MAYQTLLIAPTQNTGGARNVRPAQPDVNEPLPHVLDEVITVANLLDAELLVGKRATVDGLIDRLGQGWEIIWMAGHGSEEGIYLESGLLTTKELAVLIRSAAPRLTVFNTCASYDVARLIHREVLSDFVCTVRPVPDREAYITGAVFAQHLSRGATFFEAYEATATSANGTYEFLPARGLLMPPYDRRDDQQRGWQPEDRQYTVDVVRQMHRLEDKIDQLRSSMSILELELTKVKEDQKFSRFLLLVIAGALFFSVIALWVIVVQGGA